MPPKALQDDGCKHNGMVVIEAGHGGHLQHGNTGGELVLQNNDSALGDGEDVSEDICQLVCTFFYLVQQLSL